MILGDNFMQHIGIGNYFLTDTIRWIDQSVKMKISHFYDGLMVKSSIYEGHEDEDTLVETYAGMFGATKII